MKRKKYQVKVVTAVAVIVSQARLSHTSPWTSGTLPERKAKKKKKKEGKTESGQIPIRLSVLHTQQQGV